MGPISGFRGASTHEPRNIVRCEGKTYLLDIMHLGLRFAVFPHGLAIAREIWFWVAPFLVRNTPGTLVAGSNGGAAMQDRDGCDRNSIQSVSMSKLRSKCLVSFCCLWHVMFGDFMGFPMAPLEVVSPEAVLMLSVWSGSRFKRDASAAVARTFAPASWRSFLAR